MAHYALGLLATLLLAGTAHAQEAMQPAPACSTIVAPPPELAGWQGRVALSAAGKAETLATAMLVPGKGADVALRATPDVAFPVRPSHPGGNVSNGGLLGFIVTEAGTYRVALGSGAWIELVRDGQALMSTAHSPGPACTGVRKMVDFPLTPGAYLLEISGNGTATLPVLVTKLP